MPADARTERLERLRALVSNASAGLVDEGEWSRALDAILSDSAIDEERRSRAPGEDVYWLNDPVRLREKLLAHCARHVPAALVPHLEALVRDDLIPWTDPAGLPLRAASPALLRRLLDALPVGPYVDAHQAALALLEGRGLVPRDGYGHVERGRAEDFYPPRVLHLDFDPAIHPPIRSADERTHPTWRRASDAPRIHRFGGVVEGNAQCTLCHDRLHHVLTMDPIPDGLGVTGLSRLSLATCLSCLGWETERPWYRHDATGNPTPAEMRLEQAIRPQFAISPLLEARVALADLGPAWAFQAWGASNDFENLNRLGGCPTWVQNAEFEHCPECAKRMRALLQLDSGLALTDNATIQGAGHVYRGRAGDRPEFGWGTGGLGFALWCDVCKVSRWLWQCT